MWLRTHRFLAFSRAWQRVLLGSDRNSKVATGKRTTNMRGMNQHNSRQDCNLVGLHLARILLLLWWLAEDCAKFSPGRSLPNHDIKVCEPCKIGGRSRWKLQAIVDACRYVGCSLTGTVWQPAGCQFCKSHEVCSQCFEGRENTFICHLLGNSFLFLL